MIKMQTLDGFDPSLLEMAASEEALQQVCSDVMAGARAFWIKRAGEKLDSSRRDYIAGIQEVETVEGGAAVSLSGTLPNMVEMGAGAFDMHETLLGPNVPIAMSPGQKGKHVNAEGKFYRAIPFRHQTPGSGGQGGGAPMGNAYAGHNAVADAAALGKSIYGAARKLAPTVGLPGQPTQWGGRLPPGLAPLLKPIHTTDIYAGMVKQQKTYAKAAQNQYTTFRIISESQPDKWQHPGMAAADIASEVEEYVQRVAPEALVALINGAL